MTEDYYPYIKNFFKRWAGIYDIVIFLLAGVRKKTVAITGAVAGAVVLDIATGTGKQAFAFARAGYNVTGIDLSEDMLKFARKHNKYDNLKLVSGDATSLPFDDSRFDVACVSFALHDMPAAVREKVAAEMVRVTRPGGTIIAVDYALPKNKIIRWFAYRLIKTYESKYYPDFIKTDLLKLLEERGVRIEVEWSVMLGAARIVKGVRAG